MSVNASDTMPRATIAVCGERNCGKTTLLNTLYHGAIVPDLFEVSTKPSIRVAFASAEESIEYTTTDGTVVDAASIDDIPTDGSVSDIVICTRDNRLGSCDVIEFPPLRDGNISDEDIARISACDVLVWVTIGSQAWRLSEKTILDAVSNQGPGLSVLAVSRTDKIRSAADQDRLVARLKKETADYFDHRVMMRADPESLAAAKADPSIWEQIGGKDLAECLSHIGRTVTGLPEDPAIIVEKATVAQDSDEASEIEPPVTSVAPIADIPSTSEAADSLPEVAPTPIEQEEAQPTIDDAEVETLALASETRAEPATIEATETASQDTAPEEVDTPSSDHTSDLFEKLPEVAALADALEGFVALVTFTSGSPDDATVLAGDRSTGKDLAGGLDEALNILAGTEVFHPPEWVHLTLQNHQVLYGLADGGQRVLALLCRSGNPGLARNAFLRILKIKEAKALETA